MIINSLELHPGFPERVWIVVEQPRDEQIRLAYDPTSQTFTTTKYQSLFYDRGFRGVYGWIGGSGIPPQPHFDVMLPTNQNPRPGDILEGNICGVFIWCDGDYKFVAIDVELSHTLCSPDMSALDKATCENLMATYPAVGEGDGMERQLPSNTCERIKPLMTKQVSRYFHQKIKKSLPPVLGGQRLLRSRVNSCTYISCKIACY